MARDSIIMKLARELEEPVDSERHVVYVLVELRKLIEIDQDGANYKALKFCCDWVAHPVLNGTEAQNIVRQFDKYQALMDTVNNAASGQVPGIDLSFLQSFGEILRLSKFRTELGGYLRLHGLDSRFADDNREWTQFLTHYTSIIEDCPLKCVGRGLKHVDEVVLKVMDVKPHAVATGGDYRLMIKWSWLSKTAGIRSSNIQFY
jgi:hypothetical protein